LESTEVKVHLDFLDDEVNLSSYPERMQVLLGYLGYVFDNSLQGMHESCYILLLHVRHQLVKQEDLGFHLRLLLDETTDKYHYTARKRDPLAQNVARKLLEEHECRGVMLKADCSVQQLIDHDILGVDHFSWSVFTDAL
jgi:hypothetical protein